MKKINSNKIKLFLDGPKIDEIEKKYEIKVDGYTFNPSLFKKNGAKDYLDFCNKIVPNDDLARCACGLIASACKQ